MSSPVRFVPPPPHAAVADGLGLDRPLAFGSSSGDTVVPLAEECRPRKSDATGEEAGR